MRSDRSPSSTATSPASLDNRQKKSLRTIGHHLNPIIMVSHGLSDNIHAEIERALEDHELIKIKINTEERADKKALVDTICTTHQAHEVQQTGNILLLYRPAKEQNPKLSNLVRHRDNS